VKVLSVVISCIIDVYLFHLFFQNYFSKRKFFADSVLKHHFTTLQVNSLPPNQLL